MIAADELPGYDAGPGDWVQAQFSGARPRKCAAPAPVLTEFHKRCCAILSRAYRTGIYNLNVTWEKAEFRDGRFPAMVVTIYAGSGMGSYDFDAMTRLVIAAHENCVRIDVEPRARGYFRIHMSQRQRTGGMCDRHPTIEQAIEAYRTGGRA